NKTAKIGIVCTGLAGLPFAESFAVAGYHTCGFNLDPQPVESAGVRGNHLGQPRFRVAASHPSNWYFAPHTSVYKIADQDVIFICVPTEIDSQREFGLKFVRHAAIEISRHLRHGQLIVVDGTLSPDLGDESLLSILESSGLGCPPSAYNVEQQ